MRIVCDRAHAEIHELNRRALEMAAIQFVVSGIKSLHYFIRVEFARRQRYRAFAALTPIAHVGGAHDGHRRIFANAEITARFGAHRGQHAVHDCPIDSSDVDEVAAHDFERQRRRKQTHRRHHASIARDDQIPDAELACDRLGVQRTRAAECDKRKRSRVLAPLDKMNACGGRHAARVH